MTLTIIRGIPEVKTIGIYELNITRNALKQYKAHIRKGTYVHVVNLSNGFEGDVWSEAADMLLCKVNAMDVTDFEKTLGQCNLSTSCRDISMSVINNFSKLTN